MTEVGKYELGLTGFPTPNEAADTASYLLFCFQDAQFAQYLLGAARALTYDYNWYKAGDLETWEASEAARLVIEQAPYNLLRPVVDTPFWDDASDVDTQEPSDMQTWYGEVTNPDAAADELDFVENALIWGFTGLIAVATAEVGAAPAILFHTIAPKFVLAMKRGDIGEIFRIVVDGQESAQVDTSAYSVGDIITVPVIPASEADAHDLLILAKPA